MSRWRHQNRVAALVSGYFGFMFTQLGEVMTRHPYLFTSMWTNTAEARQRFCKCGILTADALKCADMYICIAMNPSQISNLSYIFKCINVFLSYFSLSLFKYISNHVFLSLSPCLSPVSFWCLSRSTCGSGESTESSYLFMTCETLVVFQFSFLSVWSFHTWVCQPMFDWLTVISCSCLSC